MELTEVMIELKDFETCVCKSKGAPNSLCENKLTFEEKGKKVKLSIKANEEAKALAIDQCVCKDNLLKCDGLFLYRRKNNHWMIMVELKGRDIVHAFEQLAYMKHHRPVYKEIEHLFMPENPGQLHHEAFIVSNFKITTVEQQKLEQRHGIRVKSILHSEATKPIPDIRKYLKK
jgi:hypothetical protein